MSTFETFQERAAEYRKRFSSPPSEALPKMIVRPYTEDERNLIQQDETLPDQGREGRLWRMIHRLRIDNNRYREAIAVHPHKRAHLERLITINYLTAERQLQWFEEQHKTTISFGSVAFTGTESILDYPVPAKVPTGVRAYLPA